MSKPRNRTRRPTLESVLEMDAQQVSDFFALVDDAEQHEFEAEFAQRRDDADRGDL